MRPGGNMPFKVIMTFRKPDESIVWHYQHFVGSKLTRNYRLANEQYSVDRTVIELDPLTVEIIQKWNSEEQYDEYRQLPAVIHMQSLFDTYNVDNGISKEISKTTYGSMY